MKVYENVIIGNFLYGLGFTVGGFLRGQDALPAIVNQLQQTPVDTELGDVLLTFPGLVRLIEFKMKGGDIKKERLRQRKLALALSTPENAHLLAVSRSVHWYVEVAAKLSDTPLVCRAEPYVDALSDGHDRKAPGTFEHLIEHTAREAVGELDPHERALAQLYLRLVRMTLGKDSAGAGGLLLVVGGGGTMHFAHLQDVSDLNLPDRQWLAQALQVREPQLTQSGPRREPQEPQHGLTLSM
ncbi:hypothetical protein [Pseudomonas aeruginosa]|uniref:hypothetical protein n=1 Tax=Pseudomonas aeruginosa TaxID=287 RepID=UPI00232DCDE8|nr:hypothetical protein [Pseudomonas aeruginosa]